MQTLQKPKNKNEGCLSLYFENEGGTTCDWKKWNEELERYSRENYQDERLRMKARKELEECEEKVKQQKKGAGTQRAPRLTMSVVMQSRALFSDGKVVGVDGISAENLQNFTLESSAEDKECL